MHVAGDASFLGPSRAPTQKADMGSRERVRTPEKADMGSRERVRAPEAPETAAQKEQPASQPGNANREPATAKAKRTEQQPNAQHSSFWRYLQHFVEWRQNAQE